MVVVHDENNDYFDKEDEVVEGEDIVKEEETDLREGGEHDNATWRMPSILKNVDCVGC